MRMFRVGLPAALALAAASVSAAPVVETFAVAVKNTGAIPTTFTVTVVVPVALSGLQTVTTSLAGAYGDGARDGAAIGVGASNITGQLLETYVRDAANSPFLVHGVGAAESFAAAGGTPGMVQLEPVATKALTANPASFSFFFNSAPFALGGRHEMHGAVAAATADGRTDGVSMEPTAAQNLADFVAKRSLGADVALALNASSSVAAPHGTLLTTGSEEVDCGPGVCDGNQWATHYTLSGFDASALVLRQELGSDPLNGTVIDVIDPALFTSLFDCSAVGGCTMVEQRLAFTVSPGDALSLVMRVQIDAAGAVPLPGGLPLAALGLAFAGFSSRRMRH